MKKMAKLRSIPPICVPILTAILQFLSYVEGILSNREREYLKDVEHGLREIFGISDSHNNNNPSLSLPDVFMTTSSHHHPHILPTPTSSSSSSSGAGGMKIDMSTAPLFHEFLVRLNLYRFFDHFIFGQDYSARKTRSKNIFKAALKWLVEAGIHTFNLHTLAHALQNIGNKAFNLKYYFISAEYYSCALALFHDNITFLCDRAWALMMIERYEEALNDCYRAVGLKGNYVRAYMAIACIYLDQGKAIHAISHGFIKVLQIDPQNADGLKKLELAMERVKQQLGWNDDEEEKRKEGVKMMEREGEGGGPSKRQKLDDANIASVADFIDVFGRYNFPPQTQPKSFFI